ncbi:MAG: thioesterase [Flavobacteriales bacterium BRH_c54]|nr:MAG: thioesterase [Flavobacteriales bacterium BRH_c54]
MFKFHLFLLAKLPSAFFAGVRLKSISDNACSSTIKHRWINQNPFGSIYFAVLAMSAELTTGTLVLQKIRNSKQPISMLVTQQKGTFLKKAKGKITFTCSDGKIIDNALQNTIASSEGQTFWMESVGKDEQNETVAIFNFEWSIKLKTQQTNNQIDI